MKIPVRCTKTFTDFCINQVVENEGAMQLLLKIPVTLPNGTKKHLSLLVDTGAEANLVNVDLFPSHLLHTPGTRVNFVTASGHPLRGGDLAIDLRLAFRGDRDEKYPDGVVNISGEFYTAEIKVDGILSYPWLKENRLGVIPHLGKLVMGDDLKLISGWNEKSPKARKQSSRNIQGVRFNPQVQIPEKWEVLPQNWTLPGEGYQERERELTRQEILYINRQVHRESSDASATRQIFAVEEAPENPHSDREKDLIKKFLRILRALF